MEKDGGYCSSFYVSVLHEIPWMSFTAQSTELLFLSLTGGLKNYIHFYFGVDLIHSAVCEILLMKERVKCN